MELPELVKTGVVGTIISAVLIFIGNQLEWIRFGKKEKASVKKIESEVNLDVASIDSKKIEDEVKISKAALEWTVQLATQLEKSNLLNDKRQQEIERLHSLIDSMKEEFERKIDFFEKKLEEAEKSCETERLKNIEMKTSLDFYIKKLEQHGLQ